jgi:hypothetical protein
LNGFIRAGAAKELIYHNRNGIAACQENHSNGAFGSRRRFGFGRRRAVNHCLLSIQKAPIEWNGDCDR